MISVDDVVTHVETFRLGDVLPNRSKQLIHAPIYYRLPRRSVYVIHDGDECLYVGRTKNGVLVRLGGHMNTTNPSSHLGRYIKAHLPEAEAWTLAVYTPRGEHTIEEAEYLVSDRLKPSLSRDKELANLTAAREGQSAAALRAATESPQARERHDCPECGASHVRLEGR